MGRSSAAAACIFSLLFWLTIVSLRLFPPSHWAPFSGFIDRDEVRALMKKLAQTLTEEEIDAIMEEVDTDGDGEISFDEFRAMMFG